MIIKQVSVFLENKPGQLSFPCHLLAENNINITAACLADTSEFGILRLIVEDCDATINLLQKNGYAVSVTEIVAVSVNDVPGGLNSILEVIDTQHINVEYMYAFSGFSDNRAILIFRFTEPNVAIDILQKNNVTILTKEDIWRK